jgi:hypothetical protein
MREKGFYWVKLNGFWLVAAWVPDLNGWKTPGSFVEMRDEQFEKIKEEKLPEPND